MPDGMAACLWYSEWLLNRMQCLGLSFEVQFGVLCIVVHAHECWSKAFTPPVQGLEKFIWDPFEVISYGVGKVRWARCRCWALEEQVSTSGYLYRSAKCGAALACRDRVRVVLCLEDTERASACRVAFEVNTMVCECVAVLTAWRSKPRVGMLAGERARLKEFRWLTAMGLKRTQVRRPIHSRNRPFKFPARRFCRDQNLRAWAMRVEFRFCWFWVGEMLEWTP